MSRRGNMTWEEALKEAEKRKFGYVGSFCELFRPDDKEYLVDCEFGYEAEEHIAAAAQTKGITYALGFRVRKKVINNPFGKPHKGMFVQWVKSIKTIEAKAVINYSVDLEGDS